MGKLEWGRRRLRSQCWVKLRYLSTGKGVGVNEIGVGVIMASIESWKTSTNGLTGAAACMAPEGWQSAVRQGFDC
jgi:hypothetical protein